MKPKNQMKKATSHISLLFFIFLVLSVMCLLYRYYVVQRQSALSDIVSPVAMSVEHLLSAIIPENSNQKKNGLNDVVDNALEGSKGTYGIAIKNLKTGKSYYVHEHEVFDTGSLYKLWVMASVYKLIQDGKLREDEVLQKDVAILNEKFLISSESAEQTEGTITFTIREALKQMITISHNYAALILSERIGLSTVATYLKNNGLIESSVGITGGSPKTTASDIALFFEKLYNGELADTVHTEKMIQLLKNQQLNNGIPKYLSDAVTIAHKTGEIDYFKHDGGIVYTSKGDYIIVVLSRTNAPLAAQERIAQISKGVFDYFTH